MVKLLAINTNVEIPNDLLQYFYSMIPEQKVNKLERYRLKQDTYNSLLGEVLIRTYISRNYYIAPQDINMAFTEGNKPHILNLEDIHFNISHSNHWVICGISPFPIGIDIEKIAPIELTIARDFFSKQEYADLMFLKAHDEKITYFYQLWTLKEAYTKYLGTGITIPLDSFSFSVTDKEITLTPQQNGRPLHFYQGELAPSFLFSVCMEESDLVLSPEIYMLKDLLK